MPRIYVLNKFEPNPYLHAVEVDTTSRGSFKDLSPFFLGPYTWNDPISGNLSCRRFENLWQYSKVYPVHTDPDGSPNPAYYYWRKTGFNKDRAVRYPMGKGTKPAYLFWKGRKLDYIESRKQVYIPIYADLVRATESYAKMYNWFIQGHDLVLRDFDGYDYIRKGISLQQVVDDSSRSMGHAFVLALLLTGELRCLTYLSTL